MAFTFPAMVAWDPSAKSGVFNTVWQVFATTDTTFTAPLAITDPFGNPLTGNNLNSGAQGIIPEFQQATNATVVIRDLAGKYAWTIIAIQPPTQDSAVAGYVTAGGQTTDALNAGYSIANATLTVTYNSDGSVASTVENAVKTTFTYNTDGSVHTQTRAGITLTFTYDANGNVTGAA